MIQGYFNQIKDLLDRYARAPFVVDAAVTFDVRPGEQGYLTGSLTFSDGSVLHFREFLDAVGAVIDKVTYVYHYQDARHRLIFRYDNARHRSQYATEHKHIANRVIEAPVPTLEMVLLEIATIRGWI